MESRKNHLQLVAQATCNKEHYANRLIEQHTVEICIYDAHTLHQLILTQQPCLNHFYKTSL